MIEEQELDSPLMNRPIPAEVFDTVLGLSIDVEWLKSRRSSLSDLLHEASSVKNGLELINRLIRRTHFTDSIDLRNSVDKIYHTITKVWNLNPENTFIVAINKSNSSDSSESFLWNIKAAFSESDSDWHTGCFKNSLPVYAENFAMQKPNVVFVDEFSGTGGSINKFMNWLISKYPETKKNNFYLCLHARMESAANSYSTHFKDHFSTHIFKKGISDYEDDADSALEVMLLLEQELAPQADQKEPPSCGYGKSETLYGSDTGNTPNNVFPVFWWKQGKKGQRKTIFRRLS